jgi:hypothetical protein
VESRYREANDDALVHAMRAGEEEAVCEFIERYQHLVLIQARRFGVPPDDRQHWTAEVLYDVALAMMRSVRPVPTSLPAYLIATCRRRVMMTERARRARMVRESALVGYAGGERIVVAGCSEESLRQAQGPASEPASLPAVLDRLVVALDEQLDTGERTLLSWMGQRVPYGTMASWLGVTRSAVIKRAMRLRVRLLGVAMEFGQTLDSVDRRELVRFFRRTGALDAIALARLENGEFTGDSNRTSAASGRIAQKPEDT